MARTARMRGRLVSAALAAVLLASACQSTSATPSASPPGSSDEDSSLYGQLFDDAPLSADQELTRALQSFSVAITPLPGVTIPSGGPSPDYMRADGTFA